jgi:hypothetical protein
MDAEEWVRQARERYPWRSDAQIRRALEIALEMEAMPWWKKRGKRHQQVMWELIEADWPN